MVNRLNSLLRFIPAYTSSVLNRLEDIINGGCLNNNIKSLIEVEGRRAHCVDPSINKRKLSLEAVS